MLKEYLDPRAPRMTTTNLGAPERRVLIKGLPVFLVSLLRIAAIVQDFAEQ